MAKLNMQEKAIRKNCLEEVKRMGGAISSCGYVTVLVMPSVYGGKNCKFFHVSIAYCSENDKYSRKRGEFVALQEYFESGRYIPVPSYSVSAEALARDIACTGCIVT